MIGGTMSLNWLLLVNLSVFGMLAYNTCLKLSGPNISAFTFTLIVSCTQVLALMVGLVATKYGFKTDLIGAVKPHDAAFAVLAGIFVVLIDISFFLAFRYGSAMFTNVYCCIAGIILFTLLSMTFFGETLTVMKGVGILFGIASLVLIAL